MAKNTLVIACDGPARAGKTTLAKNLENKLGIPCVSTGKIYRALAVLTMHKLEVNSLDETPEVDILNAIHDINLLKLNVTFSGEVFYDGQPFDDLSLPEVANAARITSHIKEVRSKIVEPLTINMIDNCEYPLVISEGRDEGRIWKEANRLGLAVFLSVDPLVAAIRERNIRQAMHYEDLSLRELMNTLMNYDLDNASRDFNPTYIHESPAVYTGHMTAEIKRVISEKGQVIVSSSSIDAETVFKRVVSLAKAAGLLKGRSKVQISLL